LFTRDDVIGGMNVFQRYGLMEYGSVYGHGAYLGPDFTAEYLHKSAESLVSTYSIAALVGRSAREASRRGNSRKHLRRRERFAYLHGCEGKGACDKTRGGAPAEWITSPDDIRKLTAFFAWTAAANRPRHSYSYTNNWPAEPLAGNFITADATTWSVISIIGLLGGTGLILYFFGRYNWLGWSDAETQPVRFRPVAEVAVTPAQRAIIWFLFVSSLLFVLQTLTGGLIAHYRAEPEGFFGIDFSAILPFNIMRTWHVQLAIFGSRRLTCPFVFTSSQLHSGYLPVNDDCTFLNVSRFFCRPLIWSCISVIEEPNSAIEPTGPPIFAPFSNSPPIPKAPTMTAIITARENFIFVITTSLK
jgi:nitric oxide reductase subunit B